MFYGALYHLDQVPGPDMSGRKRKKLTPRKRSDEEDYIDIILEPQCPMTSIFEGQPQNKTFSNQNNGHLGSRMTMVSVDGRVSKIGSQLKISL